MRVERRGEQNDIPNVARIQRVHAKEFAKSHTPLHALKAVRQAGVPASERPKTTQLKVQRPGSSRKPSGEYSVQCHLDLENFAKDPPAGVFVFEEHFIFYCPLPPFAVLCCLLLPFTTFYCLLLPSTALYFLLLLFSALYCPCLSLQS